MIRRTLLTLAAIVTLTSAQACGPDFFPDVFVRIDRPDLPEQYVQGHLGILQTSFPSADLFVAFRYLSGGTLSKNEQKAWSPTYSNQDSAAPNQHEQPDSAGLAWSSTRSRFTPVALAQVDPNLQTRTTTPDGYSYNLTVPNCADDAFRTAINTLEARASTWGKGSPQLADWINGEDAVFRNCSTSDRATPKPAPAGSPALLQQDRAYQIAAATFYAGDLDLAAQQFKTIAADTASPWHAAAGYLVNRARMRQALAQTVTANTPSGYNRDALLAAGKMIDAYLATKPPTRWAHAAEMQRNLIRIRLEPEARTRELAAAVAGPTEDWNYGQDVQDILWLFRKQIPDGFRAEISPWAQVTAADGQLHHLTATEASTRANVTRGSAFTQTATLRQAAPLLDWTITLRSLAPDAASHALDQWKRTHTTPWLVAALALAPDQPAPDLVQAAGEIPATSPAYQTVAWHRTRLQLAAGDSAAARETLAALERSLNAEPATQQEPSTRNAILSLSARASADTTGFLAHLPQTVLDAQSEAAFASRDCTEIMANKGDRHRCLGAGKQDLDTSTARLFNEQAPLTLWLQAATSQAVPENLRQAIALQGWTRATLLTNTSAARSFQPLLPQPLQAQLATKSPLTAWVALARNPGLQPNFEAGVQRAYTYDFVENYRDNWCYNPAEYAEPQPAATAITAAERKQGKAEAAAVAPIRAVNVGETIIAAVAANPQDPQAPEALFLVLRMIRYGCNPVHEPGTEPWGSLSNPNPDAATGDRLLQLRRNTAALMRRYYKTSPWTKKAAPFVGEVHPPTQPTTSKQ